MQKTILISVEEDRKSSLLHTNVNNYLFLEVGIPPIYIDALPIGYGAGAVIAWCSEFHCDDVRNFICNSLGKLFEGLNALWAARGGA